MAARYQGKMLEASRSAFDICREWAQNQPGGSMRTTWVERGALIFVCACNTSPLTITPPRVTYGGRAVAIAVRSDSDKRIVVASETGGLFRTFDGGKSW